MAIRAYVLMNFATSDLPTTMKQLKDIKEVRDADAVIGPYDCIAEVETEDMEILGKVVVDKILKVNGIVKTLTCIKL